MTTIYKMSLIMEDVVQYAGYDAKLLNIGYEENGNPFFVTSEGTYYYNEYTDDVYLKEWLNYDPEPIPYDDSLTAEENEVLSKYEWYSAKHTAYPSAWTAELEAEWDIVKMQLKELGI